jgi:hypothetical protein
MVNEAHTKRGDMLIRDILGYLMTAVAGCRGNIGDRKDNVAVRRDAVEPKFTRDSDLVKLSSSGPANLDRRRPAPRGERLADG